MRARASSRDQTTGLTVEDLYTLIRCDLDDKPKKFIFQTFETELRYFLNI